MYAAPSVSTVQEHADRRERDYVEYERAQTREIITADETFDRSDIEAEAEGLIACFEPLPKRLR